MGRSYSYVHRRKRCGNQCGSFYFVPRMWNRSIPWHWNYVQASRLCMGIKQARYTQFIPVHSLALWYSKRCSRITSAFSDASFVVARADAKLTFENWIIWRRVWLDGDATRDISVVVLSYWIDCMGLLSFSRGSTGLFIQLDTWIDRIYHNTIVKLGFSYGVSCRRI